MQSTKAHVRYTKAAPCSRIDGLERHSSRCKSRDLFLINYQVDNAFAMSMSSSAVVEGTSVALRTLAAYTLKQPHIVPWSIAAVAAPILYLGYLLSWVGLDQTCFGPVVEVREIVDGPVTLSKNQKKKIRRLNGLTKEVHVRRAGEVSATICLADKTAVAASCC